jgi:hypothetical protein
MYETPFNFSYYESNEGRTPIIHAAETAEDQKRPFDPLGLTIVSYVRVADSYPLKSACVRLREARPTFRSFALNLHLTILNILDRDQPKLRDKQCEQIEREIAEVMRNELALMPQFAVTGEGIWSSGDVKCIEGNVVAAIDLKSRQRIEELSQRMVEKLEPRLKKIHPEIRLGPAKGIKITIGYYDEPEDFCVDRDLALALEELSHVKTNLWIERIALVRFQYKSLEDAKIILDMPLQPPASQPIRKIAAKPKVLAMPYWTRWCGVSYLFENPGVSLHRRPDTGLLQVACKAWVDPELPLYRSLNGAMARLGLDSANNPWSFCPLPSTSYHITCADWINDANLHEIAEPQRKEFAEFLLQLPQSAKLPPTNLIPADAFDGIVGPDPVRFQFDGLSLWGDSVLVARVAPADEKSEEVLAAICERRKHLDERFAPIGRPASMKYIPHVSLAYASDPRGARLAANDLPHWEDVFRRQTAGCVQAFPAIAAMAFQSMAEFIKLEFDRKTTTEKGETND